MIGERSEPQWVDGWKTSYCRACPYILCIYMYVPYVHKQGSQESREYFTDSVVIEIPLYIARVVNVEENGCKF